MEAQSHEQSIFFSKCYIQVIINLDQELVPQEFQ